VSRTVSAVDRVVVLLLGLVLVALGLAGAAWQRGRLPRAGDRLTLTWAADVVRQGWWPWALGATGLVLVLVALRWLVAHLPQRRLHDVDLAGSDATGRLVADLSSVAAAAAQDAETLAGVRSARGRALDERGRRTLDLVLTLDPQADLAAVSEGVDATVARIAEAIGPQTPVRVHLHVARATRSTPRVA
jgi:hypothetical protein